MAVSNHPSRWTENYCFLFLRQAATISPSNQGTEAGLNAPVEHPHPPLSGATRSTSADPSSSRLSSSVSSSGEPESGFAGRTT